MSAIKLQSSDSEIVEFPVDAAEMSLFLSDLLVVYGSVEETLPMPDHDAKTLRAVIEYCEMWKNEGMKIAKNFDEIDMEERDRFMEMEKDDLFRMVLAADYLNIPRLYQHLVKIIHHRFIHRQDAEQIREAFNVTA